MVMFAEADHLDSTQRCLQVYAASIMFGYFVRRVDKRFQLESRLGLLAEQQEDPVARLERLFSQVSFRIPGGQAMEVLPVPLYL